MGGSSPPPPSPPTIIQQPAGPSAGEQAREASRASLEAQLEFGKPLAQQRTEIQEEFGPRLARSQFDVEAGIAPLQKALLEQLIPGLLPLGQQVQEGFLSPQSLNAQQQAAQDAIRQRARGQVQGNVRESANLGGTLFSGNRQLNEDRALGELEQGFASEDIARQQAQRQQLLREFTTLAQFQTPNVQQVQVGVPQAGPSADSLFQAIQQRQQPLAVIPGVQQSGTQGFGGGLFSGLFG